MSLLNLNHLKMVLNALNVKYNALVHKMNSSRGNWEQNDPTADDYIKNRTHYSEGIKDVTVLEYIVDTDTGSVSPMASAGPEIYRIFFDATDLQSFVVGQQYSVKWNNASYTCVAKMDKGLPVLGDVGLPEGYEESGEPFLIALNPEENFGIIMTTQAGKYPVTVTTRQEVIHKLDKKFIDLPDNLVTDDALAEVAKTGSYYDLSDVPTDNVKYTSQNLTTWEKTQARTNIGAGTSDFSGNYNDLSNKPTIYTDVVRYSGQNLSTSEKEQARRNIGAGTGVYKDLTGIPDGLLQYIELKQPSPNIISFASSEDKTIGIDGVGNIWKTDDGITWQSSSKLPSKHPTYSNFVTTSWNKIYYSNGIFIAIGNGGVLAYSTNGSTWNVELCLGQVNHTDIVYGGGKFVIIAENSDKVAVSEDGVTWQKAELGDNLLYTWSSICYANGKFVAVSHSNSSYWAVYSEDGINWTPVELPADSLFGGYDKIVYANGMFCAIGNNGNRIATSTDCVTWELHVLYIGFYFPERLAFYNGYFYASFLNNDVLKRSENLFDWTTIKTFNYDAGPYPKVYIINDNRLLLYDTQQENYFLSTDGEIWYDKVLITSDGLQMGNVTDIVMESFKLEEENIPSTIARVGDSYTKEESDARYLIQSEEVQIIWKAATDVTDYVTPHGQRNVFYKITDEVFDISDLDGAYFIVDIGNGSTDKVDLNNVKEIDGGCSQGNAFCSIYETTVNLGIASDGKPDTFPSTGTYLGMSRPYDVQIVIPKRIKKIDDKYLPNNLVTTSELSTAINNALGVIENGTY